MSANEKNRRWTSSQVPAVRIFRDWGFDLSKSAGPVIHANPGIWFSLHRSQLDLAVLAGYSSITNVVASFLLRIRRIPYVFWIESTRMEETRCRRLLIPILRKLISGSQGAIVPGSGAKQYATSLGYPNHRLFVAPNSVDINRFVPARSIEGRVLLRQKLGLPNGVLCLFVGQLTQRKGLEELITAFVDPAIAGSDAHLVVVGDGPVKGRVLPIIQANPYLISHVHFIGYCPELTLPSYYAASDIFLFPTRRDVWGLVINEAMSAGLPVVSSDRAGAGLDLVEDGVTGFRFRSGDARDLVLKLRRLLDDEGLRVEMGQNARNRIIQSHTPDLQAGAFVLAVESFIRICRKE